MSHFPDNPGAGTAVCRSFVYDNSQQQLEPGGVLSERVIDALAAEGIMTAGDLAGRSEAQLSRLPGLGKAALTEIRVFLGAHDHHADAARERKIRLIKAILADYLDPRRAECALREITQVL